MPLNEALLKYSHTHSWTHRLGCRLLCCSRDERLPERRYGRQSPNPRPLALPSLWSGWQCFISEQRFLIYRRLLSPLVLLVGAIDTAGVGLPCVIGRLKDAQEFGGKTSFKSHNVAHRREGNHQRWPTTSPASHAWQEERPGQSRKSSDFYCTTGGWPVESLWRHFWYFVFNQLLQKIKSFQSVSYKWWSFIPWL